MYQFQKFLYLHIFLAVFSLRGNAQILDEFFIQQDFFYTNKGDVNVLRLGSEAGVGYENWDYSGFISLGLFFDSTRGIYDVGNYFLGGSVARKINLGLFGFRFPVLIGTTSSRIKDEWFFTVSPGVQAFVGEFGHKFGLGYQYLYAPNPDFDYFNAGSISAFYQVKIFQ